MAQWLFFQMTQFKSWHPHGSWQLSVTPGDWRPSFSLHMKNTFKIKLKYIKMKSIGKQNYLLNKVSLALTYITRPKVKVKVISCKHFKLCEKI